jgi:hypothetical protein
MAAHEAISPHQVLGSYDIDQDVCMKLTTADYNMSVRRQHVSGFKKQEKPARSKSTQSPVLCLLVIFFHPLNASLKQLV